MENDDLMIVESSSSLHLTVSHDEEEEEDQHAPALSKLSSSSSASSLDDDESAVEQAESSDLKTGPQKSQDQSLPSSTNNDGEMEEEDSSTAKEALHQADKACSTPVVVESVGGENMEEQSPPPSSSPKEETLEILNSEAQADGSLHIEVPDDGPADEHPAAKIQRLARKAGIIVGGGTMTAVGTVMLFLPCPTPSIYLMIGGMAIMSKEIPAAQRQLDTTREGLRSWVDRAEKEFAEGVRTINVMVDNGSPTKQNKEAEVEPTKEIETEEEEEEEVEEVVVEKVPEPKETSPPVAAAEKKSTIATTQVVHQRQNPVKKHFVKSCRNVIIPLLNKVCTPQEILDQQAAQNATVVEEATAETSATVEDVPEPVQTPTNTEQMVQENPSPVTSPIARWFQFREHRRESLLKAEEQREREAMLARINEANLKKLQQDAAEVVVEENEPEEEDEEEEEEEEVPAISESLQRLMIQSQSAVIRA